MDDPMPDARLYAAEEIEVNNEFHSILSVSQPHLFPNQIPLDNPAVV
jgi:hypothetical protein